MGKLMNSDFTIFTQTNFSMEKKVISEAAKYLQISKINISTKGPQISVEANGKQMQGFVSSILGLVRLQRPDFEGMSVLEKSLTHHWLTFCSTDLLHCPTHQELYLCLKFMNNELLQRTFLCGYSTTIADVALFLALHPFIFNWTYQQKEQYMNVSRWFDTTQEDPLLKLNYKVIQFSRTVLYDGLSQLKIC